MPKLHLIVKMHLLYSGEYLERLSKDVLYLVAIAKICHNYFYENRFMCSIFQSCSSKLQNFTINNLICLTLLNSVGFTSTFMLTSIVLMAIKMIEFDLFTCN